MELWIEGTVEQVIQVVNDGLAAAIATNPSIMERWTSNGQSLEAVVKQVCEQVDVPLYVQLHGPTIDDYRHEMDKLREISEQIQPKLVATHAGVAAAKRIASDGLKPLITTIATVNQAFLAASANAAYVAPYIGRIMDANVDAYQLVSDIADLYQRHNSQTRIAAASIRNPQQAEKVVLAGAHIVVMQHEVFMKLLENDLTQNWIDRFEENWKRIPNKLSQ
jgi:transaldolase